MRVNAEQRFIPAIVGGMDGRLLKYAEQSAPRYTSYPTAPHFETSVDGATFRRWLGELPAHASLSLYLHTPYCLQLCWYCGCHAFAVRRDQPVANFVESLMTEIALVSGATSASQVHEIHWGGGTPNTLSPARFAALALRLRERFDLSGLVRHAVEIDPRTFTPAHAEAWAKAGVNRASLGVQDLDASVQAAIGRMQPFETVEAAALALRRVGIDALSFDLMYGLPHQSVESVRAGAAQALSLRPARVSVFGYAHVPWFKRRQRLVDSAALPGPGERLELAQAIGETLTEAGYVEVGYDHYASPDDDLAVAARSGRLRRNFQGFVESACDALIGLGPSAISTLPQGYAQNLAEPGAWRAALRDGGLATCKGRALTEEDRLRGELIMRLLCDFALDLAPHGGREAFPDTMAELAGLERDGLVEIEGDRIAIPYEARRFSRIAARAFDAYRDGRGARHSRAV